jgi:hypothetical protein
VRIGAVLSVIAVAMWMAVVIQVSATNGTRVETLIHIGQIVSFLAFVGGLAMALWNLVLVFKDAGRVAKAYATALSVAFAVMLWISLSYHLIGISGHY